MEATGPYMQRIDISLTNCARGSRHKKLEKDVRKRRKEVFHINSCEDLFCKGEILSRNNAPRHELAIQIFSKCLHMKFLRALHASLAHQEMRREQLRETHDSHKNFLSANHNEPEGERHLFLTRPQRFLEKYLNRFRKELKNKQKSSPQIKTMTTENLDA